MTSAAAMVKMAVSCECVPELTARLKELTRDCRKEELVLVSMTPIQSLTIAFKEQRSRKEATQPLFETFVKILTAQLTEIELFTDNPDSNRNRQLEACLLLIAECFRCLRNACIQCVKNQSHGRNAGLFEPTIRILHMLHGLGFSQSDDLLAAIRCGLQFLGNFVTGNEESKHILWKSAFPDLFLHYMTQSDKKVVTYCCMVLFTCLNAERTADLLNHTKGVELAEAVIKICKKEPELDWAFLIVTDQFLKCPDLMAELYIKLNNHERIVILDLISVKLSETLGCPAGSGDLSALLKMMQFLASCFLEKCTAVLKFTSATEEENEEALIVIRLLDILCEATSNYEKFSYLQNSPGLLETVVDLLYQTHLAGKQQQNVFSINQSLSFTDQTFHPAVGFKAHLIHLIGNLCYHNNENQDKVRELGGIPIILDNCSIDDNNPFVSQWAVFTIRILTEQNLKNQEVISQMAYQGVADSAMLNNMGLQVEEQDGKLYVKSHGKSS
ncbi:ataxin-10 [Hemiscyllium ocellatum]|uniref:ataxin-10 n=1 Tax=Hemiscyllium ocellatum TaxID=170820 RepID=UPI0029672D1F|nr:ataxin-10 [Hemiscyllium ocellatum]